MLIQNGCVNSDLVRLVRMQGFEVPPEPPPAWLNELLQSKWVKAKDGVFRAQLGGRMPTEQETMLLSSLGASEIPVDQSVDYSGTLILGATMKAIARRMRFVADVRRKLENKPVWFLGGERPIDPKLEGVEAVPGIVDETGFVLHLDYLEQNAAGLWPRTETEVFELLSDWENYTHEMWFLKNCIIVDACAVKTEKGVRGPNTSETVRSWLQEGAEPGHYLVVSSQPFCENQLMAVRRAVNEAGDEGYTFDVSGPAAPPLPLSRWLDNLAKQLWEEVQLLPK